MVFQSKIVEGDYCLARIVARGSKPSDIGVLLSLRYVDYPIDPVSKDYAEMFMLSEMPTMDSIFIASATNTDISEKNRIAVTDFAESLNVESLDPDILKQIEAYFDAISEEISNQGIDDLDSVSKMDLDQLFKEFTKDIDSSDSQETTLDFGDDDNDELDNDTNDDDNDTQGGTNYDDFGL